MSRWCSNQLSYAPEERRIIPTPDALCKTLARPQRKLPDCEIRLARYPAAMPDSAETTLKNRLLAATRDYLSLAAPLLRQHGRTTPAVRVRYDLKGRSAGQVRWRAGEPPWIRYNLAMASLQPEAFINETPPHEVAHVVVGCCFPSARPHGPEWQSVMAHFGIEDASRCHVFMPAADQLSRQRRWLYRCSCSDHRLSSTRHNRAQHAGIEYRCRDCGDILTWCRSPSAQDD